MEYRRERVRRVREVPRSVCASQSPINAPMLTANYRHTVELAWMRQLLEQSKNTRTFVRPFMPNAQSSHHLNKLAKNRISISSIPSSPTYPPNSPLEEANRQRARRRIKKVGKYVVRRCREERAKKERVISALRYSIRVQKKEASRQCREFENEMFTDILTVLKELDEQLQDIVNKVRETEPKREQVVVGEQGFGLSRGMPLNHNLVMQGGNLRRGSALRAASSKLVATHAEYVPMLRHNTYNTYNTRVS